MPPGRKPDILPVRSTANPLSETEPQSEELARELAQLASDKQGEDIAILDVCGPLAITDYFVVVTARNGRHARALARSVDTSMKHKGLLRRNLAGLVGDSGWVLLDFNTVVVHVFAPDAREFYGLEDLWADVPRLDFTPAERPVTQDDSWLTGPQDSHPDSIGNL